MKTACTFRTFLSLICVVPFVILFVGCPQFTAAPWPANYAPILTDQYVDAASDEIVPIGTYPPVDVTDLALGVSGDYLYIRVDFSAPIPTSAQDVTGVWPAPAESVTDHGFALDLDVDGIPGFDIAVTFRCKLRYGGGYMLYALTGEIPASLDPLALVGELGEGGSGFDYLIARYDISELGSLFPQGTTVVAGFNAFADAVDAEGNPVNSASDSVTVGLWTIP